MSRINEPSHISMSMPYTNESCHTYEWVMSHMWMSHVTHMNESCHTYEWVMSHIWMRLAGYEWVMSHIWMSHGTYKSVVSHTNKSQIMPHMNQAYGITTIHVNESCHSSEWVMSHIWMSHVTHAYGEQRFMSIMNEPWHIWTSHVTRGWTVEF